MRFRFCGDADCPDWILSEINSLSRLSSVKLKVLGQIVVHGLINPPIDFLKAEKLFADSKLDSDINLKACIACLSHVISSAVRFNCDSSFLQRELQQLGLPREHSTAIKKVTDEYSSELLVKFKEGSLKINRLRDCSGHFDQTIKCVGLQLNVDGNEKQVVLTKEMAASILKDLKEVRKTMVELNEHSSAFL